MKENILGFAVNVEDAESCVDAIVERISAGAKQQWLACLNPHSYTVSLEDDRFRAALQQADWLVADGVGIVYASRWNKGRIQQRVTGSDIFQGLMQRLNSAGEMRVFFLGSTSENLEKIGQRMALDYPHVRLAGSYSPPFKDTYTEQEIDLMVEQINQANADVLWVGLQAPKQEKWIASTLPRLDVGFAGAVGAVFDFYAGSVRRSSPLFQAMGLEWLPRLIRQPRRLWRRMFVSAPIFIWHVIRRLRS